MTELPAELAAEIPKLRSFGGHILDLPQLLRIDAGNLANEYQTHAGWQAFIAYQHSEAKILKERAERKVKAIEADKFLYFKERFESIFGFKPTETSIECAITRDPDYIAAVDELFDAKRLENIWEVARGAFLARKDMLVNIGAHERTERKMGLAT